MRTATTRLARIGRHLQPTPARVSRASTITLQSTRGVMASVFQEVPQVSTAVASQQRQRS